MDEAIKHIREKYQRRIDGFYEMIKSPTCFVRAVKNEEEIEYIKRNHTNILQILKQYNQENDVIYIVRKALLSNQNQVFSEKFFLVDNYNTETEEEMSFLYEQNAEWMNWCLAHFECNLRMEHIIFNYEKKNKKMENKIARLDSVNNLLLRMITIKDSVQINKLISKGIIIYGVGNLGRAFYSLFHDKLNIICFIDGYSKKKEYQNVSVYHLHDRAILQNIRKGNVIIMIAVPQIYEADIEKNIANIFPDDKYKSMSIWKFFDV